MLGLLKRNLFFIICGVAALAGIGLGVLGFRAMGEVEETMRNIAGLHGDFASAVRGAVNDRSIEAERTRIEAIGRNYKAVMAGAKALNQYEPLPPPPGETFFPEPTRDGRFRFRDIYRAEFEAMLERLKAGAPPTTEEIERLRREMEEEKAAEESTGLYDDEPDAEGSTSPTAPEEPESHPSGLITTAEAKESAEARAAIHKAMSIYCYADLSSFDINKSVQEGLSPQTADMWEAQVSLWIQKDVVESLARLNDEAAQGLKETGKQPWVGVLPVKELTSIAVSPYITSAEAAVPFAELRVNDLYEVVQFDVKLVVDARDIPAIINAICKDKFHTLLDLSYEYDRDGLVSLKMNERIYGSEPTVGLTLKFESVFFGDIYRRIMPDAILGALGKSRPVDEDDGS